MLVPDLKVETPEERLFRLPRGSALVEMRPAGRPPSTASQAALFMAPHTSMQASPQRARTPPLCRPLPDGPAHLLSADLSLMGPHTSSLQASPWRARTPLCRPLPWRPLHRPVGPCTPRLCRPLPGGPGPSPRPAGGGQRSWHPLMQNQPGGRALCLGGRSCLTTGTFRPAAPELRPPGEEPGEGAPRSRPPSAATLTFPGARPGGAGRPPHALQAAGGPSGRAAR